jgi:hypothetical protein
MKPAVMLIGLGDLGSVTLELLARENAIGRIIVASRNPERGQARCNLARMSAIAQGHVPDVSFLPLDLNDRPTVAETVCREAPDLIFTAATLQTWWLPNLLPPETRASIQSARYGVWLPVHLTLTMKLMQALQDAAYHGVVLTAPYPDVVNCVLGRLGLAPTCGVGNLGQVVPKIRWLASERLHVPLDAVTVTLVAHHALHEWAWGGRTGEPPPYFLRVELDGQDVTEAAGADEILFASYPLTPGPAIHFLTAACTVHLIRACFSPEPVILHAPAPHGLPGGYPVIVSSQGVQPAPIQGLSLAEAITINERSHRFDGIERIEDDGTVVYCPASVEIMRMALGYDCPRLRPADAGDRAAELMSRFREYASRHGVRF